jgi:hypothetical protein
MSGRSTLAALYTAARTSLSEIGRGAVPIGTSPAEYAREALQDFPEPVDETEVCWHGEFTWDVVGQTEGEQTIWKCRGCGDVFLDADGVHTPYLLSVVPPAKLATDEAVEAAAKAMIAAAPQLHPDEDPEDYQTWDEMSVEDQEICRGLAKATLEAALPLLKYGVE